MYLQWESQHPISSKYSVVGTLHHRARNSVFQYQPVTARRRTPPRCINNMQIPKLGSEQNQDESKIQSKEETQKSKQEHYA